MVQLLKGSLEDLEEILCWETLPPKILRCEKPWKQGPQTQQPFRYNTGALAPFICIARGSCHKRQPQTVGSHFPPAWAGQRETQMQIHISDSSLRSAETTSSCPAISVRLALEVCSTCTHTQNLLRVKHRVVSKTHYIHCSFHHKEV